MREGYNEVEQEDEDRQSIVQDILRESTDFLRRIIVPVEGQGGVTLSYVWSHSGRLLLEDHIWWVSSGHGKKQCHWWCAACRGQYHQRDGDSPVKMVVQGLQERSCLKQMDGLGRFIMEDDREAVKVGDLGKNMESKKV